MTKIEPRRLYQEIRAGEDEWAASVVPIDDPDLTARSVETILAAPPPAEATAKPLAPPRAKGMSRRWLLTGAMAAMALGAVVTVSRLLAPDVAPPMSRRFEMSGEKQELGSTQDDASTVRVSADSRLTLTLRPERDGTDEATARIFVQKEGERTLQPWPIRFARLPAGTLEVSKLLRELPPLPAGRYELVVVYGADAHLPDAAALERALGRGGPGRSSGWDVRRGRLIIEAR